MIVRRLKALVMRATAALAHALTALRRKRVEPAAVAVGASTPPLRAHRVGTNWLEDARRLRGRPALRPMQPRPANEMLRQILRDPRWTSAFEAGRLARPPRPSQPPDERTTNEPMRATPHLPAAPSESTHEPANAEHAVESQRRLLLIRELVRRGLYNEGFKPGQVPDQYRPRSTPPGASPTEPPLI